MNEQEYRATLVRIIQLSESSQNCDCPGPCNRCIDLMGEIQQLAIDALKLKN